MTALQLGQATRRNQAPDTLCLFAGTELRAPAPPLGTLNY